MKNGISDLKFRKITPIQVEWLQQNYHKMTTKDCAEYLGVKIKTLINYAFILGLRKSPEHISQLRRKQADNTNAKRWKR
jgi:hypothetical protein